MKVVLTGSLGNIGKPLATMLVKEGHDVMVVSSNAEKKAAIHALGAKAAIGSLEDGAFVAEAFSGADAVFVMVPPNFMEADQVGYYRRLAMHYVKAIEQAGVKRVVHLSSYGAHLDTGTGFILGSHHAEGILSSVPGIALTHLRPGFFYTNLYGFAPRIKATGMLSANYGGADKMLLVHPVDIAAAAAEELTVREPFRAVRYVASDDRTANEVAQVLGAAIGKTGLRWVILTNEEMEAGLKHAGLPAHVIANLVEMGEATHRGVLRELYDRENATPGGKVKLEDFAREFAAAF